jgi:hypothetical protein
VVDLAAERWLPVVGIEGLYEVSDQGRVRSLGRRDRLGRRWKPRILRGSLDGEGYVVVNLTSAARQGTATRSVRERVHVLVLEAFVGPRPAGMQCCHKNDVPEDNRLANLRWDSPEANQADARRNQSGLTRRARRSAQRAQGTGRCIRSHRLIEPNLTNALSDGRRRCLACQRGYNAVRDAARRGRQLDLDTECHHRHYAQLISTNQTSANPAV